MAAPTDPQPSTLPFDDSDLDGPTADPSLSAIVDHLEVIDQSTAAIRAIVERLAGER